MIGKLSVGALALVLGLMSPAMAQDAAALCTSLAGSPYDPSAPSGQGKLIADIETQSAIKACQDAVEGAPGDARMHFQLGRAFDAAEQYEQALAEYGTAAELGFPLADVSLGGLYELGLGVEPDASQAVHYYQKAFEEAKLPIAAANLGYAYDSGVGVDIDKAKAAMYFELASDAGIAWATTSLGYLYEQGTGVEADYERAVELYQIAAAAGDAAAANNLGSAYERGEGGLTRSAEKAKEFYEKAIEGGSGLAMANLGNIYAYGKEGIPKDTGKAREYYRAAIKSDDPYAVARAQNDLAWSFVLAQTDLEEAEQLADAAVAYDPEDPTTLDTLGWIKHLRDDNAGALDLLRKAAELKPATTQLAHLGVVQAALGDEDAARASYEAALAAVPEEFDDASVDLEAIEAWLAAH